MAWRVEKTESGNEIVIDGWERGIGRSPFAGLENLVNVDVTGVPGQASVAYKTSALTVPPTVSAIAYTTNTSTDVITVSSTSGWYNGMAIQLNTVVTSTGISTGRVYWVGDLSGNTFKLYKNPSRNAGQVVDITGSNGSGTLSSYTFGKPIDDTTAYNANSSGDRNYYFILDENGRAWWVDNTGGTVTSNLIYLGNDTLTGDNGRGIIYFQRHLLVFRQSNLDGIGTRVIEGNVDLDSSYSSGTLGGWEYGFESISNISLPVRPAIVGQDDVLYYANNGRIASITETAGDTFELDDGASWTENTSALAIPDNDEVNCIGELGRHLLVGGIQNKIYPWDRSSSSFDIPITLSENGVARIISSNALAYIFAGTGSRIYVTNGAGVSLFYEIPDHLTDVSRPYFTLHDVKISKEEMYLSFSATENDGSTDITGLDGVWAINLTTRALRKIATASHATEGKTYVIGKNELTTTPPGEGLFVAWEDESSNYGVDTGSSDPYSGGESYIDTDAIPLGTVDIPKTPVKFEFKLARNLVSGESIEIQQRSVPSGSYSSIGTFSTTSKFSGTMKSTIKQKEWLQLRIILTSTSSSPSFVPLREIRIRL